MTKTIAWSVLNKEGKPVTSTVAASEAVATRRFVYAVSLKRKKVTWEEMQARGYRVAMIELVPVPESRSLTKPATVVERYMA
jgi:hypothetical protein